MENKEKKPSFFDRINHAKKELDEKNKKNNAANSNNKNNKNKSGFSLTWLLLGVMAFIFVLMMSPSQEDANKKLSYNFFEQCLDSGYVANIKVDKTEQEVFFELKKDCVVEAGKILPKEAHGKHLLMTVYSTTDKLDELVSAKKAEGKFDGEVLYENGGGGFWNMFFQLIFPLVLVFGFWILIMRRMGGGGGGIFSFGKSKAKLFEGGSDGQEKITFKDVAGLAGAKQEVQEVVDFLRNPQKYTELGGKIPKGILLVGPPGTGKTLLAKAVAGEANVAFFSMSGSDFVEMFVGVGASRVRDLFQQAKAKAPSIVFIDEIDAIGRARSGKASMQANDERESTLNQLLTEMDGFGANTGVIVMAATNRADILDKALLRAGRFDRQISVELPDLKERQQIFNVHLKPIKIDESVDVELLARQTPGLSGADIANVCNEAALIAARRKQEWVDRQCFLDAVDRVLGGLEKKTKVMTESEKRTIAIHEAGHATISWFLQHANPLVKVTIVPRGNALGANWYMPEERPVTTKEELLDQICGLLGGRAAEEVFTGHICTGASNDLERVTKMVYSMISIYGMGDRMPNVNYYNFSENAFSRPYSETTAQMIDEEAKELIQTQFERAKRLLMQHSRGLQELAQQLIDKEVIYPSDLERIFGPRPWRSRSDEIMELNKKVEEENKKNQVEGEENNTDYNDENEEIIRQKAIDAVVEKQKKREEAERKAAEENARRNAGNAAATAAATGAASAANTYSYQPQETTPAEEPVQDMKPEDSYNPILDNWSEPTVAAPVYEQHTETETVSEPETEPEPDSAPEPEVKEETEPEVETKLHEEIEHTLFEDEQPSLFEDEVPEPLVENEPEIEPEAVTEDTPAEVPAEEAASVDEPTADEPENPEQEGEETDPADEYVDVVPNRQTRIDFVEVTPADEDDDFSVTLDTDFIENQEKKDNADTKKS